MTPVEFQFNYPDGRPIANEEFTITLARSGFVKTEDGVLMPSTFTYVTDAEGKFTVPIAPSSTPYRVKMLSTEGHVGESDCVKAIYYTFYVPDSEEPLRAQDLFLAPPPSNLPYDEEALLVIMDAKAASMAAARRAEAAQVVAEHSAELADADARDALNSATSASASAAAALASKNSAAASQTAASQSAAAALTSKNDAAASAVASAAESHQSNLNKIAAAASATDALASKNAAASSAADALVSKNAAATSASQAAGSATTATNKAAEASTSAGTATTQAGVAKTEADRARAAANEASNKQPLNPKLTSLSGLTGGADRLAYFTGPDSMSQIGFGAAGRTLVSQGTYPEMRTTLGLGDVATRTVVNGLDDKTPDRVTTVGYAGIGRSLSTRQLPNTATNRADVIKRALGFSLDLLGSGDRPPAVIDGPMITLDYDGLQGMNIMFDWRTGTMYTYTDITPAPLKKWRKFYHEDNIADTIDNGGLIESGTNSYGTYAKYRDGTLICSGEAQPLNAVGANATANNIATIFAMAFRAGSVPSVTASCIPSASNDHYGVTGVDFTSANIATRFILTIRNGATAQNFRFWFTAVGRWK